MCIYSIHRHRHTHTEISLIIYQTHIITEQATLIINIQETISYIYTHQLTKKKKLPLLKSLKTISNLYQTASVMVPSIYIHTHLQSLVTTSCSIRNLDLELQ